MNTISMPGFTAETSLYKTSEHYQMAQVIAALKSKGAVVPQQQMSVIGGVEPGDRFCICPCCLCRFNGVIIVCSCC